MDIAHMASAFIGFLGVFLLLLTYTYIDKLEKTGCACAEHPYRNFVKNYSLFAVVYLVVTLLFPPAQATKVFGPAVGIAYGLAYLLFVLASFVFFVMAVKYTRYLMVEKCKCSEDVRREVLYIWSIVEIVILVLAVVFPILITVIGGAIGLAMDAVGTLGKSTGTIAEAVVNPVKSVRSVPANLKKVPASLKKNLRFK